MPLRLDQRSGNALQLDWHAVKEMDKLYMREQLARTPDPRPAVIGIDGIAVRKGMCIVSSS